MHTVGKLYQEFVLDDLARDVSLSDPEKAGFFLRMFVKKASPIRLHPNPDDEFSNPSIGPNGDIVGQYMEKIRAANRFNQKPDLGRIIVEKLHAGEYRILNGHHRWFAARQLQEKSLGIQIVNMVHEEDILSCLKRTKRPYCATFDLDEVLLCTDSTDEADSPLPGLLHRTFPQRVRLHAGRMITQLRELGFDVWVYTSGYDSDQRIRTLLLLHGGRPDGIINGMKQKKTSPAVMEEFRKRYKAIAHVDTKAVLWVEPKTKTFRDAQLNPQQGWAAQAYESVKELMKNDAVSR